MRRALFALFVLSALAAAAGEPKVAILGDSLAYGLGTPFADVTQADVAKLGINGARTATLLRHMRDPRVREAVRRAEIVVLSIGGNDLFGNSIEQLRSMLAPRLARHFVAARVRRVVARIRRENRSAQIVLLGLYNPYRQTGLGEWLDAEIARWDASIIRAFASSRAVTVVRIADLIDHPRAFSADRFHPSIEGHRAIAERIWRGLSD